MSDQQQHVGIRILAKAKQVESGSWFMLVWIIGEDDPEPDVLRSWSCYLDGDVPCGECGACALRSAAIDHARRAIPVKA